MQEFVDGQGRFVAGDGLQLVDGAARVAETAAGHLCHLSAEAGDDGREDERRLVADAAGRVFVDGFVAEAGEVDGVAGAHHRVGQHGGLVVGHALEEHGHRKRGHLIVRDRAVREAVNDEADLLVRQAETVALFFDQIYHSHGKNSFQVVLG